MKNAEPDDLRALLALFPLLMLFFAIEPRLSTKHSIRAAVQSLIVGLGLMLSGVGTILCLVELSFPAVANRAGESVFVLGLGASILAVISASAVVWGRISQNERAE